MLWAETAEMTMRSPSKIERFIGVAAGAACGIAAVLIWRAVAAQQHVWPFPALYFTELVVVGLVTAAVYVQGHTRRAITAWIAGGITAAFAILGAWTVGLAFMPMAVGFFTAGILSDVHQEGRMGRHAAIGLLVGALQAAAMVAMAMRF